MKEEYRNSFDEEMEREMKSGLVLWVKVILGILTVTFGIIAWVMLT